MNILVIGAGGVGASMASIAETRSFFTSFTLADISAEAAQRAVEALDDPSRFSATSVDARSVPDDRAPASSRRAPTWWSTPVTHG